MRTLTVGHTPDMDDAFMFYAIAEGKVAMESLRVRQTIEDIQTLNRRALHAELDVTAVSAASYPLIAHDYWMLSVGSSVGRGYGPVVVAMKGYAPQDLAHCRVAVPGLHTTASLLLSLAVPGIVPIEMAFERIPEAVMRGEVEAGLLIHERQLTYRDQGLLPILDLGMWWQQHMKLPLPLGLNVIKRSLGKPLASQFAQLLRDSIVYAMTHQDDAMAWSLRYGRGIDPVRARQFVSMYVNEDTLSFSRPCRQALRLLYREAHAHGVISRVPPLTLIQPPKRTADR